MVNGHSGGLDFFGKKFEIFLLVRVRTTSMFFKLSLVCSKYKFKFSVVIQLFGRKTITHGKSDLKNQFFSQVYLVKWFSGQKVNYPWRT